MQSPADTAKPGRCDDASHAGRAYCDCVNTSFHEAISAWFLGPQAENTDLLKHLFEQTLKLQEQSRLDYHPEDGPFITFQIKESSAYKRHTAGLVKTFEQMTKLVNDYSIPFFSQRYAGHMCFEMSLPGILGWVATVLNNPNNVAFEASPFTTLLEIEVGHQMCEMLGYTEKLADGKRKYWGHIACDGTVANLESIWVARNMKFYPLSLRDAMKPGNPLDFIAGEFKIPLASSPEAPHSLFSDLSTWQLLNLTSQDILDIPERLQDEYGITPAYLDSVMNKFIVQTRGKEAVEKDWNIETTPRYFISSTKHYSWPKSAALAGIGSENMVEVPIDRDARINITALRDQLEECCRKRIPVYAVVAIIGSTEEGSIDALDAILALRAEFAQKGLSFLVHADAAWGGYFASMIRNKPHSRYDMPIELPDRKFVPAATLKKYSIRQLEAMAGADSITIDPHKSGYIPYPAGGLCYRDGRMRYMVTWSAPYIKQADDGESIGIYGVEGSKPGAPAVATFLHHDIVGLHKEGHGALLGEVSWSSGRISAHWATMSKEEDHFIVVPLNPLRREADKKFIRDHIIGKSNEALVADKEAMKMLRDLGSDLNINVFACNFRLGGVANDDVEEANYLNNAVFKRLSITTPFIKSTEIPMFLSATTFKAAEYGVCLDDFKARLGLERTSGQDLFVLRNVVMSPFQTAGNFVEKIADIFRGVLVEELQHVVKRNTIAPHPHTFVLQGYDPVSKQAFLVYRPYFHNANGRFQVILHATLSVEGGVDHKCTTFLTTTKDTTMHGICADGASFSGVLFTLNPKGAKTMGARVHVTGIRVLKHRSLASATRDVAYPTAFTPFYLFGADGHTFVDHALLKAPNAQLTAEVALDLDAALSDAQLARGLLLRVARSEAAMQPADAASTRWFARGAGAGDAPPFRVAVFEDPHPATARGPGLFAAAAAGRKPLATGTMKLVDGVHVDFKELNTQDFTKRPTHRFVSYTSREAAPETKNEWRELVKAYRQNTQAARSAVQT